MQFNNPLTRTSQLSAIVCGVTAPTPSRDTIYSSIGLLASHFCESKNRKRKALLLDNNETEKQPSALVKPDNQASTSVGKTVVRIGMIRGRIKVPDDMNTLNTERKSKNLSWRTGNTKFPLSNRQIKCRLTLS